MIKIIWKKDDFEKVKDKLNDMYQIELATDSNDLSSDQVGLIVQDQDVDKLKNILELINYEKASVILPTVEGWMQVHVQMITFLESFGDDIYLHQIDLPTTIIKQPLYQLEETLKPYHFVRIGKSFIVSISKIRYIRTSINAKLDLELITGDHLEVSRSFVKSFKYALGIEKKEDIS